MVHRPRRKQAHATGGGGRFGLLDQGSCVVALGTWVLLLLGMRFGPLLLFIAVCLSSCAGAHPQASSAASQPSAPPTAAELAPAMDAYIAGFGKHWGPAYAFSGFVAVAQAGESVFERGYGHAHLEVAEAPDRDTRFQIGSVTKMFTAVAILQLVEQGKLQLHDPVRQHVPELPERFASITLHHLLSHTSGIASYTDDAELMAARERTHTPDEVLRTFVDQPLAFTPGERFAYSNSNYFLLGLVIERTSGQSYEGYLQAHVLGPAGMQRTGISADPELPNTAAGYVAEGGALRPAARADDSLPFAAGALRSTVSDLLAWERALAGHRLLTPASMQRLLTANLSDYAYGFTVVERDGATIQRHDGGIDGFTSFFARIPERQLVIVALCNNESFSSTRIGHPLVHMLLTGEPVPPIRERVPAPMPPELIERLAGQYALTDDAREAAAKILPPHIIDTFATLDVVAEAEHVYLDPSGQPRVELFVSDQGELFTKDAGVLLHAEPQRGPAYVLRLVQGNLEFRFTRTSPVP